jgi:hypothetical protein
MFFGGGGGGDVGIEFESRAMQDELRERRERVGERRADNNSSNRNSNRTMSVWRDNDMTLTISRLNDDARRLVVTDKAGKTLYEGNLDDKDDRARIPPPVAEKLRQMEDKIAPDGKPREGKPNNRKPGEEKQNGKPQAGADVKVEESIELRGDSDNESNEETEVEVREGDGGSARAPIADDDVLNISLNQLHGPGIQTVKLARVRDGQVRLPFVAPIRCAGLTERELEKRIANTYVESRVAPAVAVRVRKLTGAGRDLALDDAKRP